MISEIGFVEIPIFKAASETNFIVSFIDLIVDLTSLVFSKAIFNA